MRTHETDDDVTSITSTDYINNLSHECQCVLLFTLFILFNSSVFKEVKFYTEFNSIMQRV